MTNSRRSFAVVVFWFAFLSVLLTSQSAFAWLRDWSFDPAAFAERQFADWIMQDVSDPSQRGLLFSSESDGRLERELILRVVAELDDSSDFAGKVDALTRANTPGAEPAWRELYLAACRARRAQRLAEVVELAPQFVYTKHYAIGASHYAYTEDATDEDAIDYSFDRQSGGQLCLARFNSDGTLGHEVLVETSSGTIRDPEVSWDGKKILFSMRADFVEDDFHLYEYDLETKTTRQITFGAGVADIEPIYLPNGELLFCSTRAMQITDCSFAEVSNLFTCDAQGRFLRRVSVDQVTVNHPVLLDDGRVVYTRWDYNDRGQLFPQPLFQMNVDGTGQTEFYGNNSYFPTSILHARGVPGSDKVVAIAAGHHVHQQGKLCLIDRARGTQENSGVTLLAPVRATPSEKVDVYGQEGELFQYPYPLDESSLLCSYLPEGTKLLEDGYRREYPIPFGIYWFDYDGRRELLAFDPAISCGQPYPLVERERPQTRPSQVDLTQTTGKFYVQDVYAGPGLAGVARGTIKALRVVALEFRSAGVRANENRGESGAAIVSTPVAIDGGTWDVKHVLGTVPVEEDGSAYFEVPALTPVYFQLLDKNGDCVQTMRSWSTLQPGETFGCVGCHEPKGNIIENANGAGATTLALKKGPAKPMPELTPGAGIFQSAGFSFVRDVQPILDAHCVRCHTGERLADGKSAPFSLRGNLDVTPLGRERREKAGRYFSEAYLNLTDYGYGNGKKYVIWLDVQGGPDMRKPYESGAANSPLIAMFRDKDGKCAPQNEFHKDVRLDERALRTLALWIDLLVPYCGDYVEQADWTPDERAKYEYYHAKRVAASAVLASNVARKIESDASGETPDPSEFSWTDFGGAEDKRAFINGWHARRIPSVARRIGKWNVYRNLAVNPKDEQGDEYSARSYPHATSNSEYGYLDEFAAKNAIDGKKENRGHGPAFPSWGPNLRTDLWLNVDFGCEVEIDKCVLYLRADFPHDAAWKRAKLEFSDGSVATIELEETAEPQTFTFPKRRVRSVKLTGFETDSPEKWHGVTEIEYWGVAI